MTNYQNHEAQQQLENMKAEASDSTGLAKRLRTFMCGWGALVTAGIMSLTFLLCIAFVPSTTIFPVYRDPYRDMFPLIQQGNVRVYPPLHGRTAILRNNDTHFITMPPTGDSSIIESLQKIMKSYPRNEDNVYRQCWLENPTYGHPCFFNVEWLGSECTETNNFGYTEVNGTFSPCVILRIEDTGNWAPVPSANVLQNDPGFLSVSCNLQFSHDARKLESIHVSPQKGFSRMYFPVSNFDPKLYLYPIVTVQLKQLAKGENVTLFCQIGAANSYYLEDEGQVTITFGS